MFLFTTPPRSNAPEPPGDVRRAISSAAQAEGVPFNYLMTTARRESGLKPTAAAPTSSARGLYQFIEQTWLGLMREEGGRHGLSGEAAAIDRIGRGRFTVSDPKVKARLLALRNDPELSARLAAVLTRRNHEALSASLGRAPSQGELYIAHFLGAAGAARLIAASERAPEVAAASMFPQAAGANRAIFFERSGEARSLRAVYDRLVRGFEPRAVAMSTAAPTVPTAEPAPQVAESGNRFHSLFRSSAPAVVPEAGQPLSLLPVRKMRGRV